MDAGSIDQNMHPSAGLLARIPFDGAQGERSKRMKPVETRRQSRRNQSELTSRP
jgi:hypothetical protein